MIHGMAADLHGGFNFLLSRLLCSHPRYITCFMSNGNSYQMTSTVFVTPKLHLAVLSKENFPLVSPLQIPRHAQREHKTKAYVKSHHKQIAYNNR